MARLGKTQPCFRVRYSMKKITSLVTITSLTATFVALCAAIFSVTGIAKLFAGAALSAAIMASALELGKIVSISFLYQYWKIIPKFLKRYLTVASIVLMLITSAGIYGYLTSAYAAVSSEPTKINAATQVAEARIKSIDLEMQRKNQRLDQLISLKSQQENRLDSLISRRASSSTLRSVQNSVNEADKSVNLLQQEISKLTTTKDSLSTLKIENDVKVSTNAEIGTFLYIANMLGTDLDTVVKWFILVIVLVFDPLAVALVIAVNFLIKHNEQETEATAPPVYKIYDDPDTKVVFSDEPLPENEETADYKNVLFDWSNRSLWENNPEAVKYYNRYLKHKIEG